jgi:hypothetical protein
LVLVTEFVLTMKLAVVVFADTVTLTGTVATVVLLLVKLTTAPPSGARPLRVTVPVDEFPPMTELGLSVRELGTGGFIMKVALFVVPL